MADQSPPPPPLPSTSLFDCVKTDDFSGMVSLYASTARDSVVSYATLRKRWNPSSSASRVGSSFASEEKVDEFFQQQQQSQQYQASHTGIGNAGHPSSAAAAASPGTQSSSAAASAPSFRLDDMIADLTDIVANSGGGGGIGNGGGYSSTASSDHDRNDEDETMDDDTDDDDDGAARSHAFFDLDRLVPAKKKTKQSTSPRSSSALLASGGLNHQSFKAESAPAAAAAASSISENELGHVVRESCSLLTNSRPGSDFVVFQREDEVRLAGRGGREGRLCGGDDAEEERKGRLKDDMEEEEDDDDDLDEEDEDEDLEEEDDDDDDDEDDEEDDGPPLFDGSVANATPGGGPSGGGGGGAGTILHLACALDSPFALAILLTMGGDAAARHTAFRRLTVHEAACADSPDCLGLLLELGEKFRSSSNYEGRDDDDGRKEEEEEAAASRSRFVAPPMRVDGGGSGRGANPYKSIFAAWAKDGTRRTKGSRTEKGRSSKAFPVPTPICGNDEEAASVQATHGMSFVATLRMIQQLGDKVLDGTVSDIDAARSLMSRAILPEATRSALVSACCPLPQSYDRAPAAAVAAAASASAHAVVAPLVLLPSLSPPVPTDRRPSSDADGHGNTPLHWASFKNATSCVSVLLAHRADANARAEPSGWTPLHDAAYSDASDCVDLLVRVGRANVDARANSGATPLCFAAQEDAPRAARLLLEAGADPAVRCAQGTSLTGGGASSVSAQPNTNHPPPHQSRFSGYTPLHYCAHYNAHRAARVLLNHETRRRQGGLKDDWQSSSSSPFLLDIPDLNEKLPIHVAVARGSSDVLRELLHGGARVDITGNHHTAAAATQLSPPLLAAAGGSPPSSSQDAALSNAPSTPPQHASWGAAMGGAASFSSPTRSSSPSAASAASPVVVTPISSPVLRSMIPSRPIASSKPWNCLTQEAIDQCKALIREAELNWCPQRHPLFHPTDRRAILELLRVGKRLEQRGTGIFIDLWPCVLSFCGRGWFEPEGGTGADAASADAAGAAAEGRGKGCCPQTPLLTAPNATSSGANGERGTGTSSSEDEVDFTQFQLE